MECALNSYLGLLLPQNSYGIFGKLLEDHIRVYIGTSISSSYIKALCFFWQNTLYKYQLLLSFICWLFKLSPLERNLHHTKKDYTITKTVYYETGTERALLLSVLEAEGALGTPKANSKGSWELVLKLNFSSEKNTKETNKQTQWLRFVNYSFT